MFRNNETRIKLKILNINQVVFIQKEIQMTFR